MGNRHLDTRKLHDIKGGVTRTPHAVLSARRRTVRTENSIILPINLIRAGIQQRLTHSIVQQSVRTGTYFKTSLCATVIEALGKMRFREAPASSLAASLEEVLGASPYFILYCMRLTISGKVPHDAGPVRLPGAAFACATPQGSARSSARISLSEERI
jgi:hypothetical protein